MEFVGHVLTKQGIKMSDEKIRKVLDFPLPTIVKELRSFIGLVNYFSEHIRNCSTLLRPLMSLIMETTGDVDLNSRRASKLPLVCRCN
jgi:hypothetical protein